MFITAVVFLLTLLVLVISHEFGHFIVAKKFGIKVLEFGFGLPPRVWGKKIGETLVSLNWLPLGGFVRLLGEDEVDPKLREHDRSFAAKPVGQRIAVVVAGVSMNLLLAVILFYIVLGAQGFKEQIPLLTNHQFVGVKQENQSVILVGGATDESPAAAAGIKQGDRITKLNGVALQTADELVEKTKQLAGTAVTFTLLDPSNVEREVVLTPRTNPPAGQGPIGIRLDSFPVANLEFATPVQKVFSGFTYSYNVVSYSGHILGNVISQSLETRNLTPVSQSVAGPVGITSMTSAILQTEAPLIPYLSFVAMLSLNLAIVNILPIPALDGGRLVFLLIEGVLKRKVRAEVERWVHSIGMAILLGLILLITFSDIKKLF